jgi:Flp pilus assembly pilin Flp
MMSVSVSDRMRSLRADRRGITSLEYAILAAAVVVAIATSATPLGTIASELMQSIIDRVPN